MLARADGTLRRTSQLRSGTTVITKVTTRKTGAMMLEVVRNPAPMMTRPANTKIPNRGGACGCPAMGVGSGGACAGARLGCGMGCSSGGGPSRQLGTDRS